MGCFDELTSELGTSNLWSVAYQKWYICHVVYICCDAMMPYSLHLLYFWSEVK